MLTKAYISWNILLLWDRIGIGARGCISLPFTVSTNQEPIAKLCLASTSVYFLFERSHILDMPLEKHRPCPELPLLACRLTGVAS